MKILVTFATRAEFAPWRRRRSFRSIGPAPHPTFEATVGENTVRVLLTGMGWENTRRAMHASLEEIPEVCISSGLAGGLKPMYPAGEILAARSVSEVEGGGKFPTDEELLQAAAMHGATIVETFVTSRFLVGSSDEKRRISQFGDAVEMESFPLLEAACGRGIPAVAIRAVSDTSEEDLPYDFSRALDERGRVRWLGLLAQIARRPQRLPALLRLGRESLRASESLAEFLDVYVGSLPVEMNAYVFDLPVAAT